MSKRETNYFKWNTEARAMLLAVALSFVIPVVLRFAGFPRVAAGAFSLLAVTLMVWHFTYVYRAGEQRRRQLEFDRVWGRQHGPDRDR